jgi:hypothetical protein
MALARTPPHDAFSNLSKWVESCGFHRVPEWLQDRKADAVAQKWARRIVAISFLIGVLGFTIWYRSPPSRVFPIVAPIDTPVPAKEAPNPPPISPSERSSVTPPDNGQTASYRPLKALTNAQLSDSAIVFAGKMRTFESNADATEYPAHVQGETKDQQIAKFEEFSKHQTEKFRQKELIFDNEYLGQARELRDELTIRLQSIGILSPYVDIPMFQRAVVPHVFDTGSLAGADPVTAAADYLEKLARRLPP